MSAEIFMRPDFDLITQAGAYWMEKVMQEAIRRGYVVNDLPGWAASLTDLKDMLITTPDGRRLFYGVGHGSETQFTGQHRERILDLGNADLMKGWFVHLMSCRTGVELGPALIQAGALGFVGYTFDYYVLLGVDTSPDAIYTQAFLEPDITFALAVLEGKSLNTAYQLSLSKLDEWIEYFRGGDDPNADIMIWSLLSNREHFLVLTPTGKVSTVAPVSITPLLVVAGVASVAYLFSRKHK